MLKIKAFVLHIFLETLENEEKILQKLSKYIIPTYMIYFWKSKDKKVSKKTFISIIGVINTK